MRPRTPLALMSLAALSAVACFSSPLPTAAQDGQRPKNSESQLVDLSNRVNRRDVVDLMAAQKTFTKYTDANIFMDAQQAVQACFSVSNELESVSEIVHMYRSMSATEQAANLEVMTHFIKGHKGVIDSGYQMVDSCLNADKMNEHPGLVDDLTTAKADIRKAADLLDSDSLLTN